MRATVECPIRDHKGNGKIERLIRTINEQLKAKKNVIIKVNKRTQLGCVKYYSS